MKPKRKALVRLLLVFVGGFAVILMQGCAIAGVAVYGRVMDVETGKPVEGAYVYAESGHKNIRILDSGGPAYTAVDAALTRTDKEGRYRFSQRFYFGSTPASKVGKVKVYKPGYITAPEMVAKSWKSDYSYSPSEYVASYIPSQYFYGSGDYRDDYADLPLNSSNRVYYLSSRPVQSLDAGNGPSIPGGFYGDRSAVPIRIKYLASVMNGLSYRTEASRQFRVAMYREAASLARGGSNQGILRYICLKAQLRTGENGEQETSQVVNCPEK